MSRWELNVENEINVLNLTNVEIGNEAAQFHFLGICFEFSGTVCTRHILPSMRMDGLLLAFLL